MLNNLHACTPTVWTMDYDHAASHITLPGGQERWENENDSYWTVLTQTTSAGGRSVFELRTVDRDAIPSSISHPHSHQRAAAIEAPLSVLQLAPSMAVAVAVAHRLSRLFGTPASPTRCVSAGLWENTFL